MGQGFDPRSFDLGDVMKQAERGRLLSARERALATIDSWQKAQKVCWYCGQRPPFAGAQMLMPARLSGHRDVTDLGASKLVSTEYTEVQIEVPRCARCYMSHNGKWENYIDPPQYPALFNLLAVGCFLLVSLAIGLTVLLAFGITVLGPQIQAIVVAGVLGVLCYPLCRLVVSLSPNRAQIYATEARRKAAKPVVKQRPGKWPDLHLGDDWSYMSAKQHTLDLVPLLLADAGIAEPGRAEKLISALGRRQVWNNAASRDLVARALADVGPPAIPLISAARSRASSNKHVNAGLDQAMQLIERAQPAVDPRS